ncbi:hypothetical protein [Myroides marinus]|uniref:Lipoprotein n=1 Tax=Myroides marinus TaxID=703342 RepID=A0A165R384_9FLAO|nr:hypothetical protein [Myroides marinus]KZE78252.1 hypothetical protein AV926_12405 [Myroides marinus]MDM1367369.1 hypothetical protein [Myroides marinus]MDM1374598.1 hypothetical protein [Myroides marinus]MDM1381752.1 hypothetical protein [Myroides marinus]
MKKMFLGVVLALTMFSCGGNVDVNGKIVNTYEKFSVEAEKLMNEIDKGSVEDKMKVLDRLEVLADSCSTVTKDLKESKEATGFKNAVIDVYSSMKADVIPTFKELVQIDETDESDANIDKYNKIIDKVNAANQKIDGLENKAIQEQRDFANAVNMKLQ